MNGVTAKQLEKGQKTKGHLSNACLDLLGKLIETSDALGKYRSLYRDLKKKRDQERVDHQKEITELKDKLFVQGDNH